MTTPPPVQHAVNSPTDAEVWVVCRDFPSYSVSSFGRVRRNAIVYGGRGSIRYPTGTLSTRPLPSGHLQVTLCQNNKPATVLVHRLVAIAFVPNPLDNPLVCHKDDDPQNNAPQNLYWGTRLDNARDMVERDRQVRGSRSPHAKLTDADVGDVKSLSSAGVHQRVIAKKFGVSQSLVSMIVNGRVWRHLA